MDRDLFMDPEEAVNFGIIDSIMRERTETSTEKSAN